MCQPSAGTGHLAEAGLVRRIGAIPIPRTRTPRSSYRIPEPRREACGYLTMAGASSTASPCSSIQDRHASGGSGLDARRVSRGTTRSARGPRDSEEAFLNLVFVGGELLPNRTHMWGPTAIDQLDHIRVNTAVFGAIR